MIKSFFYLIIVLLSVQFLSAQTTADPNLGIIPAPKSILQKNGFFQFSNKTILVYENPDDRITAEFFQSFVKENFGYELVVVKNLAIIPENSIIFSSLLTENFKDEAYQLNVQEKVINLKGKQKGLFYAMQTLLQLSLNAAADKKIPNVLIDDEPRYAYRGLHLDVCRHFFQIDFVKKYIDLMAMYKLNNFHWHLTDDQGWRIEIKKHPKLTQIGGFREQTIIGNYHDRMPQWFDGVKYGGFYTQEEIKELVAYAASKHVNVIPEIEMPGHSLAALSAYPELGCGDNPGPFKAADKWGVFPDIYCAGKEETFQFLEEVLTEVIALFPSPYIHIGGDEAPKTRWKTCLYCQKRIKKERLKDENELQSYFISRIEKFVNKQGRSIIGWDEILDGGIAANATLMAWRNESYGIEAAKQNHKVIMSPSSQGFYLDHVQGRSNQEPLAIGGDGRIEKIYAFNPTPKSLNALQQKYIFGVQANMWTEYLTSEEKVEYMLLPRIMALAEVAWTPLEKKNFKNFTNYRVPIHLANFDKIKTNYRVPPTIGAKDTTIYVSNNYKFNFSPSVVGANVYYTIDGYDPDETTTLYANELTVNVPLKQQRVVKTRVISPSGKRSVVTKTVLINNPDYLKATDTTGLKPGNVKYYFIPGEFSLTTEIDTSKATEKGLINGFTTNNLRGKSRMYGIIYTGYINVNEDAEFEFSTLSDDGSKLYIDDELVVDNDGKHARFEIAAGIKLNKGLHKIKVAYFDTGGGYQLQVYVKGTDKKKLEIPSVMLYN